MSSEVTPQLPMVSVIIPVYDDTARLQSCLERLAAQTYPSDRWEVIVVDNGSKTSPREIVERFPFCRFAEESMPGSYAARNRGLKMAQGQAIAFTDSDCLPAANWLEEGVRAIGSASTKQFAGGRIEIVPNDINRPTAIELYDMAFGLNQKINVLLLHHAATANMFAPVELFRLVGPFDSTVKSGGDMEWGQRAARHGASVLFADRAVVSHPARTTYAEILRQTRRHVGGRADRKRMSAGRFKTLHFWKTLWRSIVPDVGKIGHAKRLLRERGYGTVAWLRTIPVVLAVQYVRLWEFLRKFLGFPSERR
ncbi:MAG: glycosyltransferase [Pirellulales bacterium]